jgi:hypothetical protein
MNATYQWLLEFTTAAIRLRALTELLDCPGDNQDVVKARDLTWQSKDVQKMLSRQNADAIWEHNEKEYGVHTSLRYLTSFAELGLHKDPRLDRAAAYAIHYLEEKESADMHHDYSGCSNALLLRGLVMLGYHAEPAVRGLIDRYAAAQLFDGGFMCRRLLEKKPGRRSCYKASLAALLLYSECWRKSIALPNTDSLVRYFLKRDVFYTGDKTKLLAEGRLGWRYIDNFFPVETMRIGLPLILSALCILGVGNHPALAQAWEMLESKKNEAGHFLLEGTLTSQPCSFGKVGAENPWVTLYAYLAEKYR